MNKKIYLLIITLIVVSLPLLYHTPQIIKQKQWENINDEYLDIERESRLCTNLCNTKYEQDVGKEYFSCANECKMIYENNLKIVEGKHKKWREG